MGFDHNTSQCVHPLCVAEHTISYFAECILELGELDFELVNGRLLVRCDHGGLRDATLAIASTLTQLFHHWGWWPSCAVRPLARSVAGHIARLMRRERAA